MNNLRQLATNYAPTRRRGPVSQWLRRLQLANQRPLPMLAVMLIVALVFGTMEPLFFSERNFVNLILQMSGVFMTAIGVVFVLLVAELDLSIAYIGAVGSITMTILLHEGATDWPWWLAIGTALLLTMLIGLLHGAIITRTQAPSFVVTLAGLLVWNGVVLILTTQFTTAGTIVIQDPVVLGIANSYLPDAWGWLIYGLFMTLYIVSVILRRRSQLSQGLPVMQAGVLLARIVAIALVAGAAVWYANRDRGVPVVAMICLLFLTLWSSVLNHTRFGRYVYAVGGNPEAARRAGIDVDRIRVVAFMISGLMAGVGGIVLASRLRSVDTNTGGGNLLLNSIAAAVIGGTSLFGGRGRVSNALFGALLIVSVENGMTLLGLPAGVKTVINGVVLLIAVIVDALTRNQREATEGVS